MMFVIFMQQLQVFCLGDFLRHLIFATIKKRADM